MKKTTRALTLLTVAALSFGSATMGVPTIAGAVEAQEQTMADTYSPYFEDVEFSVKDRISKNVYLQSDQPLPAGTTLDLLGDSFIENFVSSGGVSWSLSRYSSYIELHVQAHDGYDWDPDGESRIARIVVTYPDGTSEIITNRLTVHPTHLMAYPIDYGYPEATTGQVNRISPQATKGFPDGTRFSIVGGQDLSTLTELGWNFDLDPDSGVITLDIQPSSSGGNPFRVMISIQYPDGSNTTSVFNPMVSFPEPEPTPSDRSFGSSSS